MTRKECLEQAMGCVLRDRNNEYGEPEQSFHYIADLWSAYLRTKIEPYDAAAMMALFKLARLRFNPYYEDGWADLAGYAACGAELAGAEKAREDATRKWGEEYKRLSAEAEGGCCQNGNDQPEFKYGDAAEWYSFGARGMEPGWHSAVYLRRAEDPDYCVVREPDGRERIVDMRYLRRPEAKAEGVEELVVSPFDEDRMRESMPGIVPQDEPKGMAEIHRRLMMGESVSLKCPAPHKPTGEELAEMAEEEAHG